MNTEPQRFPTNIGDLDISRPVHLAGVGGSAMSGLAILLAQRGFTVVGSDHDPGKATLERLIASGVTVHTLQDGSHIPKNTQLVVATAALPSTHPELEAARSRGIPVVKYAGMLGAILDGHDGVAVAGTHGKTTTAAMIVAALRGAGIDVGFIIGGHIPQFSAAKRSVNSDIFVAEACEYDRSFLNLTPRRAVITNIETDHLDIYSDLDDVLAAFSDFTARIPPDGALFHNADCPNTGRILRDPNCRKISLSTRHTADYEARNIRLDSEKTVFELFHRGKAVTEIILTAPGLHNVANALAAMAVCRDLGFEAGELARGIAAFEGIARRFEVKGAVGGTIVVDDYAHHPTEIRALLQGAAARYPSRRLIVAFQPHQISRTGFLFDELAACFSLADLVFVADIFTAREEPDDAKRSKAIDLTVEIRGNGTDAEHIGDLEDLAHRAATALKPGDIFLTVGAGNIYTVAERVLELLEKQ